MVREKNYCWISEVGAVVSLLQHNSVKDIGQQISLTKCEVRLYSKWTEE